MLLIPPESHDKEALYKSMPQCGGEGRRSDPYTVRCTVKYGVHLVVLFRSGLIPLGVDCSSPGKPMVDGIEPETTEMRRVQCARSDSHIWCLDRLY